MSTGVTGAAIGGGGAAAAEGTNGLNRITDNFGVVSGGAHNQAGNDNADLTDARYASIGGGFGNLATGLLSSIGGGSRNLASGISATVAGGSDNSATNNDAVVAGGFHNSAGYARWLPEVRETPLERNTHLSEVALAIQLQGLSPWLPAAFRIWQAKVLPRSAVASAIRSWPRRIIRSSQAEVTTQSPERC